MVPSNMYPTWDNPAIARVFTSNTSTSKPSTSSTASSSPSSSGTANNHPTKSSVPTYGIALAAIAGVLFLALLLVSIWWFCLRKSKSEMGGMGGQRGELSGQGKEYKGVRQQVAELGTERVWELDGERKPVEMDGDGGR
jgi:hypothetical protein